MGRSLRRAKKTRPTVKVAVNKRNKLKRGIKPNLLRAPVPGRAVQLAQQHGFAGDWQEEKTTQTNYQKLRLLHDPNAAFGRNASADVLGKRAAALELQEELPSDDPEFAVACGRMRPEGKAPPQRLTTTQQQVVQRLIDAHGSDVEAMSRDRKLNSMLHSKAKLRRMLESFKLGKRGRTAFRAPKKRLW